MYCTFTSTSLVTTGPGSALFCPFDVFHHPSVTACLNLLLEPELEDFATSKLWTVGWAYQHESEKTTFRWETKSLEPTVVQWQVSWTTGRFHSIRAPSSWFSKDEHLCTRRPKSTFWNTIKPYDEQVQLIFYTYMWQCLASFGMTGAFKCSLTAHQHCCKPWAATKAVSHSTENEKTKLKRVFSSPVQTGQQR